MELSNSLSTNSLPLFPTKFKVEKYPYSILKIIPYKTSYTAKEFDKVMNTLSKYNNPFMKRFELDETNRTLIYHPNQPMCFEILFTKDKITYSYAVPSIYKGLIINKLKFLLDKCDIIETEDYIQEFKGTVKQSYGYQKNWLFSLNTDEKINLADNLLVLHKDIQNENDKMLFQYVMQPLFDYQWKSKWQKSFQKYASTGITPSLSGFADSLLYNLDRPADFVLYQIDLIINAIMSSVCGEEPLYIEKQKQNFATEVNKSTQVKTVFDGFKTDINLYIKSNSNLTIDNITRNAQTIFKDLDGDNQIVMRNTGGIINNAINKITKYDPLAREIKSGTIFNTIECRQLIKTPSEQMLAEYEDVIEKINLSTLEMPKELFNKGTPVGELKKGSIYKTLYSGGDPDSDNSPLVIIGGQGVGKTTLVQNYAIDKAAIGDGVIIFDTIDGKSMENILSGLPESYPTEKIIVLDFSKDKIFSLEWNEIIDGYMNQLKNTTNDVEKFTIMANLSANISSQLKTFINTLNSDNNEMFSAKMAKVLCDITQLVFMTGGNLAQVKDCLYDSELRHSLLDKLNLPIQFPFIKDILRLDDEPEASNTFRGVETRLNVIMDNMVMRKFFDVKTDKKLDFEKWMNNGCCVIINVPEIKFNANINILITFLVQKAWLAALNRYNIPEKDRKQCHLLIDEPNKFPMIMNLIEHNLIASRKWKLRFILAIHNFDILGRSYENLKAAGASFIMMPTSASNFSRVQEFYMPYTYNEMKEIEKLNSKNGKSRFALCSLNFRNSRYPCIVKLLPPPSVRFKQIDRSHLNDYYANLYGINQEDYYKELFSRDNKTKDIIDHDDLEI